MTLILWLGGGCVALAAISAVARGTYRMWKRLDAFLEDWNGEPARPGRDRSPSMPERMAGVEKRLIKLETAVHES